MKHESKDLYHNIFLISKPLPAKTWAMEDKNEVVTELEEISEMW